MSKPKEQILIGRGQLNWNRCERQSDRYGYVNLLVPRTEAYAEMYLASGSGKLEAIVIDPIESEHVGDLFRGIFQQKVPEVGDRFLLGEGRFVSETKDGVINVGVKPVDGRGHDWLDPQALYNCHGSVVELHWYPA